MSLRPNASRTVSMVLGLSLLLVAPAVRAGSVSQTIPLPAGPYLNGGSYNWPPAIVPQFNPSEGQCLDSVCIKLDGGTINDIGFENYQSSPAVVTVNATATITLKRPDLTTILFVVPAITTQDTLTSFDGNLDYMGSSGRTYNNLVGMAADNICLTSNSDLALFTGNGAVNLPAMAVENSFQIGASSWSIGVRPFANIIVTYNYRDCAVPVEPTTWSRIKHLVN